MSEEVFPGFTFSVFSYVVSLLRPEIIRDLDLPRHGLHILPLESTFTPLRERRLPRAVERPRPEPARARAPFAARRRGLRRVRPPDASHGARGEAAPRHGAARPGSLSPARPARHGAARRGISAALGREQLPRAAQAAHHERGRLPRRMVRDRGAQGDEVGERHHRHLRSGRARPAPPTCCCTTTWARSTARSAPGASPRAATARSARRSPPRRGPPARRSAPKRRSRTCSSQDGRAHGVVLENGEEIARQARGLRRRSAPHLPAAGGREAPARRVRRGDPALQLPRLLRQGQPRARRAAATSPACPGAARICAARSRSARASTTSSAPTTRRSTASSRAGRTWTSSSRR